MRLWAYASLSSADLDPGRRRTGRATELERQLERWWSAGGALVERGEILHLNVRLPDETVLLSLGRLEATRGDVHQVTAVGDLVQ